MLGDKKMEWYISTTLLRCNITLWRILAGNIKPGCNFLHNITEPSDVGRQRRHTITISGCLSGPVTAHIFDLANLRTSGVILTDIPPPCCNPLQRHVRTTCVHSAPVSPPSAEAPLSCNNTSHNRAESSIMFDKDLHMRTVRTVKQMFSSWLQWCAFPMAAGEPRLAARPEKLDAPWKKPAGESILYHISIALLPQHTNSPLC